MIGWIKGRVILRNPAAGLVIIDANGVGWELQVSIQTFVAVPAEGETVELWVHTNVREDAINLFGFADLHERSLFRMLTSVPKVGPRNAVAVLGGFPVYEFAECIAARDAGKLVKIPGIGKKTAEQITLTLGDKVIGLLEVLRKQPGAQLPLPTEPDPVSADEIGDAAREVLTSLGWKSKSVDRALAHVLEELGEDAVTTDLDQIVRASLARLMDR